MPNTSLIHEGLYNDAGIAHRSLSHETGPGLGTGASCRPGGRGLITCIKRDEGRSGRLPGLDLCRSASITRPYPGSVIVPASSSITSLADLAGKNIGIPGEYGSELLRDSRRHQRPVACRPPTCDYFVRAATRSRRPLRLDRWTLPVVGAFTNNDAVQDEPGGHRTFGRSRWMAYSTPRGGLVITTRSGRKARGCGTRGRVCNHRGD